MDLEAICDGPPLICNNPAINVHDINILARCIPRADAELIEKEYNRLFENFRLKCILALEGAKGKCECLMPVHVLDIIHVGVIRSFEKDIRWEYSIKHHCYIFKLPKVLKKYEKPKYNGKSFMPKQKCSSKGILLTLFFACYMSMYTVAHWCELPEGSNGIIPYLNSKGFKVKISKKKDSATSVMWGVNANISRNVKVIAKYNEYNGYRTAAINALEPECEGLKGSTLTPRIWGMVYKDMLLVELQPVWKDREWFFCFYTCKGDFIFKTRTVNPPSSMDPIGTDDYTTWANEAKTAISAFDSHRMGLAAGKSRKINLVLRKADY